MNKLTCVILLAVLLFINSAHVYGQFVQGGYDFYRSSRIPFTKSHSMWTTQVPFPNDGINGVQETVFDTVRGKSYSLYSLKPNFSLLEVDLTSGKSNFINVTIPNWEKYQDLVGVSSARVDSKGNLFVTILSGYNSLVVRVELSNRIGKVSFFERTNIYTSVLSEIHNLFIIGVSPSAIFALDSTSLALKWTSKVSGQEMILVNSEIKGNDVIYASDYNILNKILASNGQILSSYKFPYSIISLSYVNGINGWVSVAIGDETLIQVAILHVDKQIETSLQLLSTRRFPHVEYESYCSYPIATANQTGNILEIISVITCEISPFGSPKMYAVKSQFDKNSQRPLNEPNLIWENDSSNFLIAQFNSNTLISMENFENSTLYFGFDMVTGKVTKSVPSTVQSDEGFTYFVTSVNKKIYRYSLTPVIKIESIDF